MLVFELIVSLHDFDSNPHSQTKTFHKAVSYYNSAHVACGLGNKIMYGTATPSSAQVAMRNAPNELIPRKSAPPDDELLPKTEPIPPATEGGGKLTGTAIVEAVEFERLDEAVAVYNFEVEDWHTYYVGSLAVLVHNLCENGMGPYKENGGHHPMAKKAFEGVPGYDPDSALTISKGKLTDFKVQHAAITGQQNSLYTAYAKTGQPLTMDVMRQIEIKAMVNVGVPLDYATDAVNKAIADLIESGVTQPIRIPWN